VQKYQRMPSVIRTPRLELVPFPPEAIQLLLRGERDKAQAKLALKLPESFPSKEDLDGFLPIQLHRMLASPDRRDWTARLITTPNPRQVIGHAGFHGPPEVIGRAEIGYTVFKPFRGQGYAKEAATALVDWAFEQGQQEVFASVAPENAPSLAVVRALGFIQVGTQMDEVDGLELVFAIRRR
jgi:ribosomal-protein-alanine N-acetyltransferase